MCLFGVIVSHLKLYTDQPQKGSVTLGLGSYEEQNGLTNSLIAVMKTAGTTL